MQDSATLTSLEIEPDKPEPVAQAEQSQPDSRSEPVAQAVQSQAEPRSDSSPVFPEFGPMTFEQYKEAMKMRVKSGIEELAVPGVSLQKYLEFVEADRVIVEVDQVVGLFEGQCSEIGCNGMRKVVEKKVEAGVLFITHQCSKGHGGVWSSSSVLGEKRGQKLYVSSVLLASSVLVSGNNFEKVSLLAKSMNLNFVSSTTFSRIQSLYCLPSIGDLWGKMKEVIWKVFEEDVLVICGDGRMDSPGFSAKYCVYTMMEHYLNVIG